MRGRRDLLRRCFGLVFFALAARSLARLCGVNFCAARSLNQFDGSCAKGVPWAASPVLGPVDVSRRLHYGGRGTTCA